MIRTFWPRRVADFWPAFNTVIAVGLPHAWNQLVSYPRRVLFVSGQLCLQCLILPLRAENQQCHGETNWNQRPQGPKSQGDTAEEENSGDITRVAYDRVGPGVDDRVTTFSLNAALVPRRICSPLQPRCRSPFRSET